MAAKNFKCAIEFCGEKEKGGTIKGKEYCKYHFAKFVHTAPLVREQAKLGRNAKCGCGSGKKYKSCCINKAPKQSHYYTNREKQAL